MEGRNWIRFSLRALLGMIALICISMAAWDFCKHRAIKDVKNASGGFSTTEIVAPYLLCVEKSDNVTVVATYHVWCFGLICDLPYSRRFPETGGFISIVRPRILFQEEDPKLLGIPEY